MATNTIAASALVMTFDGGNGSDGKQIVITKSFRNIKNGAPYDDLFAVAQKLQPLQKYALISIERNDKIDITA
ncbi:DUF1659 domain-containing protein [Sporolactobacillus spathodeae]|uniref:DUF1659 domain-containing protein n=1 Tax=Sporolactobacillus spathodeae TaxID=1465502 RepID=A0ABS2QAD6_9BACL|nr:DUF1659 domain-containing protein [Sporolactobacillus spathodeae]MBM7658761.1 hypothetical protein [Sporolactobacillus spathodeae]